MQVRSQLNKLELSNEAVLIREHEREKAYGKVRPYCASNAMMSMDFRGLSARATRASSRRARMHMALSNEARMLHSRHPTE